MLVTFDTALDEDELVVAAFDDDELVVVAVRTYNVKRDNPRMVR